MCAVFMAAGFCMVLFSSCDNTIDPLNEERGSFSIFGGLNMNSDTNYVRVRDLNIPIREGETWEFDGTVTITNTTTSETEQMSDTLVNIDGVYVWNFGSAMPINATDKYEVTAENEQGKRVTATATAPNISFADMPTKFPNCKATVNIVIEPVKAGFIEADVGFEWRDKVLWLPVAPEFGTVGEPDERKVLEFRLLDLLEERLGQPRWCHEMSDNQLYVRFTHFGPDFSERVQSDFPDLPGAAGNLGAYYKKENAFTIDTTNICKPNCDFFF